MNILIISDLGIASPRIPNLASGLIELNHNVYLFTPKMTSRQIKIFGLDLYTDLTIIQSKYFRMSYERWQNKYLRKIWKLWRQLNIMVANINSTTVKIKEEHFLSVKKVIPEILNLIDKHQIDILLTSSGPISMQIIGRKIKLVRDIKWISDYQDLWSLNHNSTKYNSEEYRDFESNLLNRCDGCITVSEDLSRRMSILFKGPIQTVYLAFFKKYIDHTNSESENIQILYTGQIYPNYQNLSEFLSSVVRIQNSSKHLEFIFVGQSSTLVKQYFESINLSIPNNIILIPKISRSESLKLQSLADLLLIFKWEDKNQLGVIPTKFYEYVSTNSPILAFGTKNSDEMSNLISSYQLGTQIYSGSELDKFLLNLTRDKINALRNLSIDSDFLSYKSQAKLLENFLKKLFT